jgi:hypothetical protein
MDSAFLGSVALAYLTVGAVPGRMQQSWRRRVRADVAHVVAYAPRHSTLPATRHGRPPTLGAAVADRDRAVPRCAESHDSPAACAPLPTRQHDRACQLQSELESRSFAIALMHCSCPRTFHLLHCSCTAAATAACSHARASALGGCRVKVVAKGTGCFRWGGSDNGSGGGCVSTTLCCRLCLGDGVGAPKVARFVVRRGRLCRPSVT